jgi:hypothetical protein
MIRLVCHHGRYAIQRGFIAKDYLELNGMHWCNSLKLSQQMCFGPKKDALIALRVWRNNNPIVWLPSKEKSPVVVKRFFWFREIEE